MAVVGSIIDQVRAGAVVVEDVQLVIDRRCLPVGEIVTSVCPGLVADRDDRAVGADDLVERVSRARVGELDVIPAAGDVGGNLEGQVRRSGRPGVAVASVAMLTAAVVPSEK